MKSAIKASVLASSVFISSITLAGQVTIPNTFSSGTPAVATEVNGNFTALETGVNDNDTRITNNTADIGNNASAIGTNTTDIGNNASAIGTNTADIGNNASAIGTNTADIGNNASAIGTNTTDIGNNLSAITAIQAKLPIVVMDGNIPSQEIGTLVNVNYDAGAFDFDVFTPQGYLLLGISFGTGSQGTSSLIYTTADCTGVAYSSEIPNGVVFSAYDSGGVAAMYYVEKSTPSQNITGNSYSADGACIAGTPAFLSSNLLWPVIPNDPVVTGVPGTPYMLPITMQRAQ